MFASLGDIVFRGLYSPQSLTTGRKATYAEHARIGRTPRLQRTGTELQVIELPITLDLAMGIVPAREIDKVQRYLDSGEIIPYISGTGRVLGDFVITSFDITATHALADGTLQRVEMQVQLRETGQPSETVRRQAQARAQARAVLANNPIPTLQFAPPPTPETPILADFQEIRVEAAAATAEAETGAKDASRRDRLFASARERTNRVAARIDAVVAKLNDAQNVYYQANGMIAAANNARVRAELFADSMTRVHDIDSALASSRNLSAASAELNNSTAVLGALRAVRRV